MFHNDFWEVIFLCESKESRLLFFLQTENQQRLIKLPGSNICLLDVTYKTAKYTTPHFFIVLKTNLDYQVVASFALQDETTSAIKEAILILKIWTPLWQPKSFMGENYEKGINSIGHVFPIKGNNA